MKIANVEEVLTTWRFMPLAEYAQAMDVAKVSVEVGFARSRSEAQRLIEQGGLRINDVKINEPGTYVMFPPGDDPLTIFSPHVIVSVHQ